MDEHHKKENGILSHCPSATSNFFSSVFFTWVYPFIKLGNQRELQTDDLHKIPPGDDSERLGNQLESEWNVELKKDRRGGPSLTKALIRMFWLEFCKNGLVCMLEEWLFRIGQPLCLSQLVLYFNPDSEMPQWQAYLYATGVILGSGLYTFTHHPYFFTCSHLGMRVRVACCSLVYKKSLRLSQKALGQTSIGQMVNVMSNDVSRFDSSATFLHYFLVGPVQVILVTIVLLFYIGPSCLVGLVVIVLFVPLQTAFGKIFTNHRMKTARRTDQRIRSMNEIVSAMKVIKMYTWEESFTKLIDMYRRMEVDAIRRTAYLRSFNASLYFILSKLVVFLTFVVYVLTGNTLAPNKVFMTVALFNNVRDVMTRFFSSAITYTAEARTSIKRVENFLLLDEIEKSSDTFNRPVSSADCLIDCQTVTVKWPATAETEDNTLTDITFTVRPGQVLAVTGQVGSGKSSLLNVIMGELSPLIGSCVIKGKIAYAPQDAWIFSGTIRHNIICGFEFDAQRYKKVVKAAALERDFSLFPQGDQTAVGEKGISLSGGQKARINLARCLYVDADIYLMDDPLSAVDTHVGRHLFDQSVNGFLRDKIRVLVTHQLQYLKNVDQIIVLKKGRMEAMGSYDELCRSGLDFTKALKEDDDELNENSVSFANNDGPRSRSPSKLSFRERRSSSVISRSISNEEEYDMTSATVFVEESRSTGSVSFSIYWQYFTSGGGIISIFFLILSCLITQALFSGSDYWLSIWTNASQHRNVTGSATNPLSWKEKLDNETAIYVYLILISGVFIFALIRTLHFFILCMFSSIKLHNEMFKAVIRAPLSFFDKNPVGRILNRFAKDIGCMDDQLPPTFFDVISIGLNAVGTIIVVGVVNYRLMLPVIFVAIMSYTLRIICLPASRAVKRLEATTKSPVFTHLSSSLAGLTILRAHQCEDTFKSSFNKIQDVHSSAWYMFLATSRWLGITVDWTCVAYVACVTYTCTSLRGSITSSAAGLAISSAMSLTGMFQWGTRQSTETGNLMTCVERVIEYSQLPSEAALESTPDKKPDSDWPGKGSIQFGSMTLSYNEGQPILKNITCFIPSKSKIGIVGRTGAGKSSLITALFRLTEPDGRVLIDGIDIKSIGLHDLRSKISIIPQDPVLFSGSLRKNLDPFGVFDDDVLWRALEDAKLKESLGNVEAGLDWIITEGGSNLSVGQKQLVCLSRAILRQNKILILDEATANVDQKTDSLIQQTIREKFTGCTVLTIAHRLNTIMDSDMVMVLDAGFLKEFDEPVVLLENSSSIFYGLVKQTGYFESNRLIELAKQAAENRV